MKKSDLTKEIAYNEFFINNKSYTEIGKDYDYSNSSIRKKIKNWEFPSKERKIPLKGRIFGKLTVSEYFGVVKHNAIWYCNCECGKIIKCKSGALLSGKKKSCGCYSEQARKENADKKSKYERFGEIPRFIIKNTIAGAKHRNLTYNLTAKFLHELFIKQDCKCALSGLSLIFGKRELNNTTASLDRIDSDKGYEENNVRWIHKSLNKMKLDFKDDYFVNMCRLVAENTRYLEFEKQIFSVFMEWEYSGGFAVYQKVVKKQDKIRKEGEIMTKEQLKERIQAFLSFGEILAKATKNPQDDEFVKFIKAALSNDIAFEVIYFIYTKIFNKDTANFSVDGLKSFLKTHSA